MLSFFPRGVLDEILNLIESVSEVFSSYSLIGENVIKHIRMQINVLKSIICKSSVVFMLVFAIIFFQIITLNIRKKYLKSK